MKGKKETDSSLKTPEIIDKLLIRLETVIRGKRTFLEYLITCMVSGGHVLIEDVPGLGKTTVAKTLAKLISAGKTEKAVPFSRIQFTPDLLPYDITGVDIFNPETKKFSFNPGPIFANIVLADEINRTSPKVQSALLEVMGEKQVTVGKKTYKVDPFFFVIATQNPIEIEGTYPLPAAQIDRFLMRLSPGYPDRDTEIGIIMEDPAHKILPVIKPVCGKKEILQLGKEAEKVFCDDKIAGIIIDIAESTRVHNQIELGVSPRGSLMLLRACKSFAFIKGRSYIIDQDVIDLAPLVFAHRIKVKDPEMNPVSFIRETALARFDEIDY